MRGTAKIIVGIISESVCPGFCLRFSTLYLLPLSKTRYYWLSPFPHTGHLCIARCRWALWTTSPQLEQHCASWARELPTRINGISKPSNTNQERSAKRQRNTHISPRTFAVVLLRVVSLASPVTPISFARFPYGTSFIFLASLRAASG